MTPPAAEFDAVIIGAGHNGLTAGAYLARKGKRVCILERSDVLGGMAQSRVDDDGNAIPRMAHLAYNLNPRVLRELGIAGKVPLTPIPTTLLSPDGRHIEVSDAEARYVDGALHSESATYVQLRAQIKRFAELLAPLALKPPPDLSGGFGLSALSEMGSLAKLGINLRLLGKADMREFLRVVLSNAYDFILDELSDGPLAGGLAADAVWGAWLGPRSPGTVFSLMYRYGISASAIAPVGGMASIIEALAACARNGGAEIRTQSHVTTILVENDSVRGVALADGSAIHAKAVMSSLDPYASMIMAGVEHFDTETVRRIRNVRTKGTTAKINLVLKEMPEFLGLNAQRLKGRLIVAPSVQYAETAFNAAKYGAMAPAPVMEIISPSRISKGGPAEANADTLSVIAQYIPYHLEGGWTDDARDALGETVLDTIAKYAPDIRSQILHMEALSPADIEQTTGAPGGHWHHCELSTDQLLNVRPINGMSRYGFGVKGYYLCGAGAHPGGDVSGTAGRNSALQVIKDGVAA